MNPVIELSIQIYSSPTWIWKALTDRSEIENWWGDDVILEPKVGGVFREPWEDDEGRAQLASGKVLEAVTDKKIVFTWKEKTWPKEALTKCTLLIESKGKSCVVSVKHEGWESLPESQQQGLMKDFKIGWNYHLKELQSYLDD